MQRIAIESNKRIKLILSRVPCDSGKYDFFIPGFKKIQFPIHICFAVTTNEARGRSSSGAIGIDFRHEFLTHGQLYVAMSRMMHLSNILFCSELSDDLTTNVPYNSALSKN